MVAQAGHERQEEEAKHAENLKELADFEEKLPGLLVDLKDAYEASDQSDPEIFKKLEAFKDAVAKFELAKKLKEISDFEASLPGMLADLKSAYESSDQSDPAIFDKLEAFKGQVEELQKDLK